MGSIPKTYKKRPPKKRTRAEYLRDLRAEERSWREQSGPVVTRVAVIEKIDGKLVEVC